MRKELLDDTDMKLLKTTDKHNATEFLALEIGVKVADRADGAVVYVNASTRLAEGQVG